MNAPHGTLRLGFAGTPQFALPALDAIAQSRHRLMAVFTQPDRPAGRGQAHKPSPVKQRALELGLDVHQPETFRSEHTLETLQSLELDALVVVAYGLILPGAALDLPRLGCFNIHASLLPRWRGAAPIQRALLAGDAQTGVTIMRMAAGLDTGPMLAVRTTPIGVRDTAHSLQDKLAAQGAGLIVETLEAVALGHAREEPQPQTGITYAEKLSKHEARIDWREDARELERRVRAFNPWPTAVTSLDGTALRIWEAELAPAGPPAGRRPPDPDCEPPQPGSVLAATPVGIDVACGRGALRLLKLQLAGRRTLCAADFINSRRLTGARFATS